MRPIGRSEPIRTLEMPSPVLRFLINILNLFFRTNSTRLFDLYMILLKQHLERMNDWLVRAESRMALDDVIEPTYELVQLQTSNHQVCGL